jgi:hypothetical protein
MIEEAPMEVGTRGRVYTSRRERRQLELNDEEYGRHTPVVVTVVSVDRDPQWDGVYAQSAKFHTELGYYGSMTIPASIRRTVGIVEEDHVRLTVRSRL